MLKTMYDADGIGLAATQVDVHIRLVVMDLSEEGNDPRVFVNPEYKILEYHRKRVEELGWSVYDLNAGHDAMLSNPHDTINLFYKILSNELIKDI